MTSIDAAPPAWTENRFRAFIRSLQPMTPEQREAFRRVYALSRACEAFQRQYSHTGDPAPLRMLIPALTLAWREAFALAGVDPDATGLMPEMPKLPAGA